MCHERLSGEPAGFLPDSTVIPVWCTSFSFFFFKNTWNITNRLKNVTGKHGLLLVIFRMKSYHNVLEFSCNVLS